MTCLVLGILLLLSAASPARAAEMEGINHAEVCGRCHRDILKAWKASAHARALENPLFQDAMERAEQIGGAGARRVCLGCHAPTVRYSGDWALKTKASWEGVTCDFCHSLKSVKLNDGLATLDVSFDGVKTGPLRDASSMAHQTAFSPVHTSSLVCAGCHEYRNPEGFAVLTTYSEWEASRYAREGVNCQNCHMGETAANVVDPKVKRLSKTTVNLHEMPGSRSIAQLNKAVRLRLTSEREGNELVITAEITNRGAGHSVPTGSPLRQMNLEVSVQAAGAGSFTGQRSYQRRVADARGIEIDREEHVFLRAAKTISDSRLKVDETRQEVFRFPVPVSISARVSARLSYYYSPQQGAPEETSLNFLTLSSYAPARR